MTSAELWTQERNLSFRAERETLIYVLGRVGREELPPEVLIFLAEHLKEWSSLTPAFQGSLLPSPETLLSSN